MTNGIVFDIQRFSIHDGPGIRTTVFLKGCPLSCPWCHNPESQSSGIELIFLDARCGMCGACVEACEKGAVTWSKEKPVTDKEKCSLCGDCTRVCFSKARQLVGREMTVGEALDEVERDVPFYDESGGGVTLSGGEPLIQEDFTLELLRACKSKGIHTVLDTCGFAEWSAIDRVREHVDLFLYDLKMMDDRKHGELVGASNGQILRNLTELSRRGNAVVLRIPVVPGVNDSREDLREIGAFAATLGSLKGVDVLPYHRLGAEKYTRLMRPYRLEKLEPLPPERMVEIQRVLQEFGLSVRIEG